MNVSLNQCPLRINMLLMTEMGLIFKATKVSLHVVAIIVIISFIFVLCVLIILTLTAALAKIDAGKVLCSARTSGRRIVFFALTTSHLNDGLWSW